MLGKVGQMEQTRHFFTGRLMAPVKTIYAKEHVFNWISELGGRWRVIQS